MLICPKPTTHLHKFRQGNHRMYVADLSQCLVLEIDNIVWEILDLCPYFSSEEIIEELGKKYDTEFVIAALDSLATLEQQGLLFSNPENSPSASGAETPRKLKILTLQSSPYATDITLAAGGVSVAHHNLIKSLEAYASLDVVGERDEKFNENVQSIKFQAIYAGILCQVISVLSESLPLLESISTVLGGFLIALALYWFGIFAAGDAKLVWGASMLMPVSLFAEASRFAQYTPTALVINIFVPYCLVLVVYLLIKTQTQQKWEAFVKIFRKEDFRQQIFNLSFQLIFLLGLQQLVSVTLSLDRLGIELEFWHQLYLVIFLFFTLNYYLKKYDLERIRNFVVCVVLIELMVITTPWTLEAWAAAYLPLLKIYFAYIALFFFARQFIQNLDDMVLNRQIHISELKEGMVPAEQIVKIESEDEEVVYSKQGFALPNVFNTNIVLGTLPGGVSKKKVAELKQLAADGQFENFDNKIRIQHTVRFAPLICLGVILTLFCRGPFFTFFQ